MTVLDYLKSKKLRILEMEKQIGNEEILLEIMEILKRENYLKELKEDEMYYKNFIKTVNYLLVVEKYSQEHKNEFIKLLDTLYEELR